MAREKQARSDPNGPMSSRLLRDLGACDRLGRPLTTDGFARLEPKGIFEQRLPSHRGAGFLMHRSEAILLAVALTMMVAVHDVRTQESEIDSLTGLKINNGWELVRNNCIACHSLKLVTQQRGSATQWLALIRWMQDKQNLWQFDPDTEKAIIDYLAENYPPQADRRRAAIAPQFMPPNPYSADTHAGDHQQNDRESQK